MEKKIILIAGATSMIGNALLETFDQPDNILILLGQNQEKLELLANEIKTISEVHVTDFASETSIYNSIEEVLKKYQRIDAIIYNIAIYPWKSIEELSTKEFQQALEVNLTGAFILTKACIPTMKKYNSGKIVYISSIAGETIGVPNMAAYGSSKAGLNGLMRTCALELARFNINVNSISPGKIYDSTKLESEKIAEKLSSVPLGKFIDPLDIAHITAFLISDKATNITGQNFIIDGGQSIL